MTLNENMAYIKGLTEGLDLDKTTKEGKIIDSMLALLEELCLTVSDLEEEVETLNEYIEEIDEDLGNVEEVLYDECGCDCEDDCDCDCDCDCDDDYDDYDDDFYELECPSCGETVFFDESIDPEELKCPNCGEDCSVSKEDLAELDG